MKKLYIIVIVILLIIIGYWLIFVYNQEEDIDIYQGYENTKYGFKLEYPKSWHFSGLTADSSIISFRDTLEESGEGGVPLGAKIEIIVLENYDNLALEDWIDQSLVYGPEQAILSEETVKGKNIQFLVKTFKPISRPVESVGPPISAYALINDRKHIVQINYLGREPNYTAGMNHFKHLLLSFWAENVKITKDPSSVVLEYIRYTLNTVPGAKTDHQAAKRLLTPDLAEQFADSSFSALMGDCIKDKPTNVRIASVDYNEKMNWTNVVVEAQYDDKWIKIWNFEVVPVEGNNWLIKKIKCYNADL